MKPALPAIFPVFLLGLACGGKADRAGTTGPTGDGSASDCVEVATVQYGNATTRKTWDTDDRILTAVTTSDGSETKGTLKWRYRADGQPIAYIGVEQPFQYDYSYDGAGNVVEYHLSYPAPPDVAMPSSAPPTQGATNVNDYDTQGRLTASTSTPYGETQASVPVSYYTFVEDPQGRCSEVDSDQYGTSVFSYDDAGRVTKIVKTGAIMGFCVNSTTNITFDDAGRVLQTTLECSGGNSGPNSGGTQTTTHTYHADGSETVDFVDGLSDVGDGRSSIQRSAACLAQDAAIGKPLDARCSVATTRLP